MAKLSASMSVTVNYVEKYVEYSKIELKIDDLDLEQDIDSQLQNFDGAASSAYKKLASNLKNRVLDMAKQ